MRTQVKTYTFTAGTRQITVTDNIAFTKSDIAIIVNRTQQKVLFTVPDYNLITDVTNKVITYDNSLPVLAEGDVLWIEIDIEVTAQKIVYTPGDITVTPIQGQPDYYHDLAYEIAQWPDLDYPYCYAILLSPSIKEVNLYGASKYKVSDGTVYSSNSIVTIGENESGRENKHTKFVIYRTDTPYISFNAANYPVTPILLNIIGMYIFNCSINNVLLTGSSCEFLLFDDSLRDPLLHNGVRTKQNYAANALYGSKINTLYFPKFRDDATDEERYCGNNALSPYYCPFTTVIFPDNGYKISLLPTNYFNASFLKTLVIPASVKVLEFGCYGLNNGVFSSLIFEGIPDSLKCIGPFLTGYKGTNLTIPDSFKEISFQSSLCESAINLTSVYIGLPTSTFANTTNFLNNASALTEVEIGDNWTYSIYLNGGVHANILGATWETKVFAKLLDLHSVNNEIPYVKITAGALNVWEACTSDGTLYSANVDNAKFTTIFRVGQIVIVNISGTNRSYTIASIQDDNRMTMTNSSSMVAGTYLLNHNKIVTINPTDLGVCSAANKAVATNKLWQLVGA
ncbi:MAG: hypothetical protein JXQ69_03735 [Paludibacteraceae bacterium]|nr:hypothetical protein [Paludibacteraceae bacterium]